MDCIRAINYEQQIIIFGGYDNDKEIVIDTVKISSKIISDNHKKPKWINKPQWKLPTCMMSFGYVLYKHYVITFGGDTFDEKYMDSIYFLNLQRGDAWKQLKHIKCPLKSGFNAILTSDNKIHLFANINKWPNWKDSSKGHFSISIKDLMGKYYPYRFDLSVLKYVDTKTRDIVYGYFRNHQSKIDYLIPHQVIDVCLIYYFI